MKRPKKQSSHSELTVAERRTLAQGASYEGSSEHKVTGWWGGLPHARQRRGGKVGRPRKQTTTVCPLTTEEHRSRATEWVRRAIAAGQCRFVAADKVYPKNVWYGAEGRIWFGYCINSTAGEYKGWPISEEERDEIFGRVDTGRRERER